VPGAVDRFNRHHVQKIALDLSVGDFVLPARDADEHEQTGRHLADDFSRHPHARPEDALRDRSQGESCSANWPR